MAAAFPQLEDRTKVVWPAFGPQSEPARSDALARTGIKQPYVLFVGTNEPRKDLATLVAAFAMLPTQIRSATQLVIAGSEGWKTTPAPRLAEQAGIADRVIVTGHVCDDVLQALYAHARCLAMPSLLEGFGLPVVEAQRHGVPAVVSDAGSLPEVAGQGALLVPVADTPALARALADMLSDDRLHSDLSASASHNASRFLDAHSARQMEALFHQAIAQRHAGI